ncbi:hypothetical protein [Ulvibacter litoralis]|uniref:Bulb-type lectin domain-containing protein n=1 Tax=Ulvibacter litoralis TaxID=227084 RepID=A0A1G7DQS4_9FLAO|nr:hypothetical protein [Ulvibacter litoralis]GHC42635.1 lipoprotein [Ulvibacter litoralis]SDE53838.1 hypothetical protein SAMN05421855_1011116 [Ulvibacter litoralis]
MKKIYILLFVFCTVIFTQSCSSTDTSEPVEETNDDEVDPTDDEIPIPESWQKTIGGIWYDQVNSMIQTADGGFILCGTSNSSLSGDKTEESRGGDDVWIIKLSANGTIQWDKTYGGSEDDFGFDILQTADGGYIVAATSESNISGDKTENSQGGPDYWVLKLNSDGTLEWQNTIGGDQTDVLKGIVQTPDGGYMLAGHSGSDISGDKTLPINLGSGFDQWYVKISSAGIIQDQKDFSFPGGGYLKAFKTTTDNSFISGINIQNGTGEDYLLYKSNASGSSVWQRHFGGDQFDILEDVIQTTDGGYIVCGGSGSNISGDKTEDLNGNFDYWILKTDSSGAIEWQNSIGGNELNWG